MDELPELVQRAYAVARQAGFPLTRAEAGLGRPSACLPGVGRFLGVLAVGCGGGRIGEIGTGAGIGAAWMASAMPADCVLVTAEIDGELAAAAARLLAADTRVQVLTGDARQVLPPSGPFDLLFADGGWRDPAGLATLVDLCRVGGRLVMDDVTPLLAAPPGPHPQGDDVPLSLAAPPDPSPWGDDVKRRLFFGDPRLISVEVVLPDLRNSLLVGTRRR
jgi:predicted O-methyltransferase YrrM